MELLKWADFQFHFGFRKEYFPFFIERLHATAARLEEMTVLIQEEMLEEKEPGHWSVKENIGHLIDIESLHEGRVEDLLQGYDLRAADMQNKKTTEAHYNQFPIGELLHHFREVRGAYIQKLLSIDPDLLDKKGLHPRLQQQVSLVDLLYFVGEHDNYHLTVIAQLIARYNK
ncbi:DinB family protein [Chitinophaga niastensis]|uniref:DinB family protein n=1 Tax=Chitinophaga niastensis TaxID=536980 RepID=A0A2P8HCC1_CHINA|nr:DinB family protein [Chitinophaga niastensis]PSL43880.1 DinB family protein [Chitinophaga niastensis]